MLTAVRPLLDWASPEHAEGIEVQLRDGHRTVASFRHQVGRALGAIATLRERARPMLEVPGHRDKPLLGFLWARTNKHWPKRSVSPEHGLAMFVHSLTTNEDLDEWRARAEEVISAEKLHSTPCNMAMSGTLAYVLCHLYLEDVVLLQPAAAAAAAAAASLEAFTDAWCAMVLGLSFALRFESRQMKVTMRLLARTWEILADQLEAAAFAAADTAADLSEEAPADSVAAAELPQGNAGRPARHMSPAFASTARMRSGGARASSDTRVEVVAYNALSERERQKFRRVVESTTSWR